MTDTADYGELLRLAYATLHGSGPEGEAPLPQREAGETLEEFLARSRRQALTPLRQRLAATPPPPPLEEVHRLLLEAIDCSLAADAALAAQVRAYGCGDYRESIQHSERVADLARRAIELDRALIGALWRVEEAAPGTLAALGLAAVLPRGDDTRPGLREE